MKRVIHKEVDPEYTYPRVEYEPSKPVPKFATPKQLEIFEIMDDVIKNQDPQDPLNMKIRARAALIKDMEKKARREKRLENKK